MDNELQHYGVRGMRWYVRKDPQAARTKADTKLRKLDRRVQKLATKTSKKMESAWTAQNRAQRAILFKGIKNWSASGRTSRAIKSYAKLQKAQSRAMRWAKAMEEVFKDTSTTAIDKETEELGKKYAQMTLDNLMQSNLTISALDSYSRGRKTAFNI